MGPQRALPLRLRQEIQTLLRQVKKRPIPLIYISTFPGYKGEFQMVLLSLTGFDMLTLIKASIGRGGDENDGSQAGRHHL
jgi:hypothetical protein